MNVNLTPTAKQLRRPARVLVRVLCAPVDRAGRRLERSNMKTNTTPEQITAIVEALKRLHVHPFRDEASDPKFNAQRNLSGKTHYVDEETLRWHKSRVLSCRPLHGGLLLRIACSDALDMNNTKRGFRAVVFDVFGETVSRPDLEHAAKTKDAAIKQSDGETIDLCAHYRAAIARRMEQEQRAVQESQAALLALSSAA